jgi:oxygen-dependent protoporphyrinogen oxidase
LQEQRAANPPDPSAPVFYAPRRGMGALVDALVSSLRDAGAALHVSSPVASIDRRADRWLVETDDGSVHDADAIVVTTPAYAAAPLLAPHSPAAAELLGRIGYASVTLVTLAYDEATVTRPLAGSGFLVPRTEGRLLTACSVFSNKWPHLARAGSVTLRASVGRTGDERGFDLDDGALVEAVHAELTQTLGLTAPPTATRVSRWRRSFPQFPAGHLQDMARLEARLREDAPGIAVTGAYLKGVGIPACIGAARSAVADLGH